MLRNHKAVRDVSEQKVEVPPSQDLHELEPIINDQGKEQRQGLRSLS